MDCIAIIPARFDSTRFPGKLLASLAGRPLIQHVVEGAAAVRGIEKTVVATDDQRIAEAAGKAGADVVLSAGEFTSGTDRVADAALQHPADIIVNVQGDEVLIDPQGINAALEAFRASEARLGTLRAVLTESRDLWDPNVVKVVIDDDERALYFSRAPVPFPRSGWQAVAREAPDEAIAAKLSRLAARADEPKAWLHLGVYFYRSEALRRWAELPPSRLERIEGLEQLRVLEAGESMQTYLINEAIPGVNTPDDLERARAVMAARPSHV